MPVLDPLFRNTNYTRIAALAKRGKTPDAIAAVMNKAAPAGVQFTGVQVSGYLAIQAVAAQQMLVSKRQLLASLTEMEDSPGGVLA